jgi:hypothetical protein
MKIDTTLSSDKRKFERCLSSQALKELFCLSKLGVFHLKIPSPGDGSCSVDTYGTIDKVQKSRNSQIAYSMQQSPS